LQLQTACGLLKLNKQKDRELCMPYVNSSAMSRIKWDSGTLSIWLTGSGKYDYYNVPEALYESLLEARSKGTFFNDHVRDQYGA
jgi:hypothetical protein